LIIVGDENQEGDFYVLPYFAVEHLFLDEYLYSEPSVRWIASITFHQLHVRRCPIEFDIGKYYGSKDQIRLTHQKRSYELDDYDYMGYGGPNTQADFYEWRAQKPYDEADEFVSHWLDRDIDHNVWIGDVSLAVPSRLTSGTWEIYSRNLLFEDCERYNDKVSALLRIYWLQNVWNKEVKA